jgi:competence protein ComEA
VENVQWRHIAAGTIGLVALACIGYFAKPKKATPPKPVQVAKPIEAEKEIVTDKEVEPEAEIAPEIFVDISGAVKNPGVYTLSEDSRVFELLELAGGLTTQADEELVNRAAKLEDGMKIIIPRKGDIRAQVTQDSPAGTVAKRKPRSSTKSKKQSLESELKKKPVVRINLNESNFEELITIPGVSEEIAYAIWKHRVSVGPFTSLQELKNVEGVPASLARKIERYVSL